MPLKTLKNNFYSIKDNNLKAFPRLKKRFLHKNHYFCTIIESSMMMQEFLQRSILNKITMMENLNVKPAEGKLGILVVGNGAVATTFMTGVLMARKGLAKPVGAMTQYDKVRVGRGDDKHYLHYGEIVPIASLDDIVFGTWDVYPQNAYQSAVYAEVLKREDVDAVRDELEQIIPMKAAFDRNCAKRLDGGNVKDCKTRWEMVEALRDDIRRFRQEKGCARIVVLWAATTEIYVPVEKSVHYQLSDLETANVNLIRDYENAHFGGSYY
jgi:myo-inositol-1-phosphate synthase